MDANNNAQTIDAAGTIVKDRFKVFLNDFEIPEDELPHLMIQDDDGEEGGQEQEGLTTQQRLSFDYIAQIANMIQNNKTTLYVNFQHILEMDVELAEAIELEFYRFEVSILMILMI
jgi:hypothetical protein